MELKKNYGIRIERAESERVILNLTCNGADTGTYFIYEIGNVTLEHIVDRIKSWYGYGILPTTEDRDKLITEARNLWIPND